MDYLLFLPSVQLVLVNNDLIAGQYARPAAVQQADYKKAMSSELQDKCAMPRIGKFKDTS